LEQEEILVNLVRQLVPHLTVPLSLKVRLLPPPNASTTTTTCTATINSGPILPTDLDMNLSTTTSSSSSSSSLQLYQKLVDAGIHMLTIHGRTRKQKAELTGPADWSTIGKAVQLLGRRIPILANGSIQDWNDVQECLRITKADGIMSSESLLEYPPLFYNHNNDTDTTTRIGRLQLANEYMDLARQYPPQQGGQGSGIKCVRMHLHRFLHQDLQSNETLRQQLVNANTMEALQSCLDELQRLHQEQNHNVAEENLSWYRRHRDGRQMSPNNNHQQQEQQHPKSMISHEHNSEYNHDQEPGQDNMSTFFGQITNDNDIDNGDY
jgi:tRNA-dihydrouridine synthase